MSSQKGNTTRNRPQRYQNKTAFKNNLHDTSNKIKLINNIQISDVCIRCKDVIEWKIKYKKYKPLTQPKTCVKCSLKTVKQAYHVMCLECGKKLGLCTKCCKAKELVDVEVQQSPAMDLKLDNELKNLLQSLPERRRRTFLRYMERNKENTKDDLMEKLEKLKIDDDDDENFDDSDEDDGNE